MVKVTVKATALNSVLKEMNSPRSQGEVAKVVIAEIKTSLTAGVSPVRGIRRFTRYKNPDNYPGDQKSNLPVNLNLSGDMLAALTNWMRGSSLYIGIRDREQSKIAAAHQSGTTNMAQRRFLPTDAGEEFTVTITRKVRNLYARLLSDILKRRR